MVDPRNSSNVRLGWIGVCLLLGAVVFYSGCWLRELAAAVHADEQAFQHKIRNQAQGRSGFTSQGSADVHAARRLRQQYTPVVIIAASLGTLLVLVANQDKLKDRGMWRQWASSMDSRQLAGYALCLLGIGLLTWGFAEFASSTSRVSRAERRDHLDLQSRTRAAPSPYGGQMTVTTGSMRAARTMKARADQAVTEPIATVISVCGIVCLGLGVLLCIYASARQRLAATEGGNNLHSSSDKQGE